MEKEKEKHPLFCFGLYKNFSFPFLPFLLLLVWSLRLFLVFSFGKDSTNTEKVRERQREKKKEREKVREREKEREKVRERDGERERERESERERRREREREKERET